MTDDDQVISMRDLIAWAQAMIEVDGDFERLPPSLQTLIAVVVDNDARRHLEHRSRSEATLIA